MALSLRDVMDIFPPVWVVIELQYDRHFVNESIIGVEPIVICVTRHEPEVAYEIAFRILRSSMTTSGIPEAYESKLRKWADENDVDKLLKEAQRRHIDLRVIQHHLQGF